VLNARGERWATENAAIAERTRSEAQFGAYRAAPRYFRARAYLETLQENMADKTKIMVLADVKDLLLDLDLRQVVDALSGITFDDEGDAGQ
jgi:regulator of protease activity HflC (stomatin/prohibitin superfamily)